MVGKFVSIISQVRGNSSKHPWWRPTLHHFTYRSGRYGLAPKMKPPRKNPFLSGTAKSPAYLERYMDWTLSYFVVGCGGAQRGYCGCRLRDYKERSRQTGRGGQPRARAAPLLNILPLRKIWHGLVELVLCNVAGPLEDFSGTGGKISASHCTLRPFRHVACAPRSWRVFLWIFPVFASEMFHHREPVKLSFGGFFEVLVWEGDGRVFPEFCTILQCV